jgi:hypothetical protein
MSRWAFSLCPIVAPGLTVAGARMQLAISRPASADVQCHDASQGCLAEFLPVLEQVLVKPSSG